MNVLNSLFLTLNLVAMLIPVLADTRPADTPAEYRQDDWPAELEGRLLERIELSDAEESFLADFPGAVGRFTDGSREIIVRKIDRATRKLHPAADCLKGAGYQVKPMPLFVDREGRNWGRVEARRGRTVLEVREMILDSRGGSWHDVSSWFWAAMLKRARGPYVAFVVSLDVSGE